MSVERDELKRLAELVEGPPSSSANIAEAVRVIHRILAAMIDRQDPDVDALIEQQRTDNG